MSSVLTRASQIVKIILTLFTTMANAKCYSNYSKEDVRNFVESEDHNRYARMNFYA